MSFLSLIGVELQKIRRSKILLILFAAAIILWLPSIMNADMSLHMQAEEGIAPQYYFFIQGLLGMSWFMFPASMVITTVLLTQTERSRQGILKMLSLPVGRTQLCLSKFVVLSLLSAVQILIAVGMYYLSAVVVTQTQNDSFLLPPIFVFKEAGLFFLSSIPMLAFFWLISVCIQTPIFSVGIGLASIIPSVLMINTSVWYAYPMAYPFFLMTAEYGRLATKLTTTQIKLIPWLPVALGITLICLLIACTRFGHERR